MSTDLDERLLSLGTHLDHERAAISAKASVVVPFGPRRRSTVRTVLAAAAAAAVIIGLVVIATNRSGDPDRPTVPPTTPPATAPSTTTGATTTSGATLHLTFTVTGNGGVAEDPRNAETLIRLFGQALKLDMSVSVGDDGVAHATVSGVQTAADQTEVQLALQHIGDEIQIRPVIEPCTGEPAGGVKFVSKPQEQQTLAVVGTDQVCTVGPTVANGSVAFAHDAAASSLDGVGNVVTVSLTSGTLGEDSFNLAAASTCYNRDAVCPTGQIAIEYGGRIYSVATVQTPEFHGGIQIAGAFSGVAERALVAAINIGAAPFNLTMTDSSIDQTVP